MLKRKIAVLIAGGLLGAQVGFAIAAQGTFPPNVDSDVLNRLLPAQEQYFAQRAASIQTGAVASGQATVPSNDTEVIWKMLPAQAKYFERGADSRQAEASNVSTPSCCQ